MAMRSGNRRQTPASKPEAATPGKPRQKFSGIRCEKIASPRAVSPLCGSPQSGKRGAPLRIFLAAKLYLVMSGLGDRLEVERGRGGPSPLRSVSNRKDMVWEWGAQVLEMQELAGKP